MALISSSVSFTWIPPFRGQSAPHVVLDHELERTTKILQFGDTGGSDDGRRDERLGDGPSKRNLRHADVFVLRDGGDSASYCPAAVTSGQMEQAYAALRSPRKVEAPSVLGLMILKLSMVSTIL